MSVLPDTVLLLLAAPSTPWCKSEPSSHLPATPRGGCNLWLVLPGKPRAQPIFHRREIGCRGATGARAVKAADFLRK